MGEYECCSCNDKFHLDEPPYDGVPMCDECRSDAPITSKPFEDAMMALPSWGDAILEIEGLVNAEVSDLMKKNDTAMASKLNKSLKVIKRGY